MECARQRLNRAIMLWQAIGQRANAGRTPAVYRFALVVVFASILALAPTPRATALGEEPPVRAKDPPASAHVEASPAEPTSEQIQAWINQLGDKDFNVREAANAALEEAGELALDALRQARTSEDAEVRDRVARTVATVERKLEADAVEFLRARGHRVTDKSNRKLRSYNCEYMISYVGGEVALADIEPLKKLSGRLYLTFTTPLQPEALAALKDVPGIRTLSLSKSRVRDEYLEHIGRIAQLENLFLNDQPITDEGMKHLKPLRNLKRLSLARTDIGDEGLSYISSNHNMMRLGLSRTNVTTAGLHHLSRMQELTQLTLGGTNTDDDAGPHLSRLRALILLSLSDTNAGDKTLHYVAQLPELRMLYMQGSPVTDDGIEALRGSECICELVLDNTKVTGKCLDAVSTMKRLHSLQMFRVTGFTAEQFGQFRKRKPLLSITTDSQLINGLQDTERKDEAQHEHEP